MPPIRCRCMPCRTRRVHNASRVSSSHVQTPLLSRVAVIGGGPAGLMAAERSWSRPGSAVTVYDQMPSVGRKLLMAGRGGLNLTHSEEIGRFIERFAEAIPHLRPAHRGLPARSASRAGARTSARRPSSARAAGCSPKPSRPHRSCALGCGGSNHSVSASPCAIAGKGGTLRRNLLFTDAAGASVTASADASFWRSAARAGPASAPMAPGFRCLKRQGVPISKLRPSNMGVKVPWSDLLRTRFEGQPLKRIASTYGGVTVRGEAVVTADGLEGGAVYALSAHLRDAIERDGEAVLSVDLRPDLALQIPDRAPRSAPQGPIHLYFPAQSRWPVAARYRAAARRRHCPAGRARGARRSSSRPRRCD